MVVPTATVIGLFVGLVPINARVLSGLANSRVVGNSEANLGIAAGYWTTRLAPIEPTPLRLAYIQLQNKIVRHQVPSSLLGVWFHIVMLPCNNGSLE